MTGLLWVVGCVVGGVGGFFGFVAAVNSFEARADRRRVAALQALAVSRDWGFDAEPAADPATDLDARPLGTGEGHRSSNQVRATVAGLPVLAFDHRRRARTSGAPRVQQVQVLLVRWPRPLPALTAYPRTMPHRLAVVSREYDIELGDPALDRLLRVQTDDVPGARRVVGRLLPVLLARRDTVLDTGGGLVLYRQGRLQAADLAGWLAALEEPLSGLLAEIDG